ncbi:NAD(P)/FAD-dependent oxidoreductase [Paenibacillus yanchengensis]|uniref:NAD(P)/FAD-dependent oxidoreductase n=1 Tax=Paenibacillus yanchengensis TaxID=2035833 RepID=A0ABW4YQ68_9BACL
MRNLVVLGGGYGGHSLITDLLSRNLPLDIMITLVDRLPFQGLKTEFYALAAGTVSDLQLRVPFPEDERISYVYGDVTNVQLEQQLVNLADGQQLYYDWLVIGLGCTDKYHNIVGAEQYSYSIQSFSAVRKTSAALNDVKPYGQVSIIGGGLSGVEVASELRESRPDLNIRLIDRNDKALSAFPGRLQTFVSEWFMEHHIEMRGHTNLERVEPGQLYDMNAKQDTILTDITVWTAGIQPVQLVQAINLPKDTMGRLIINEHHQLPDFTNVYIAGDCAALPYSPSGQAAGAQGKQIAEILHAQWHDRTPKLTIIKLKGMLGSLGKKSGFGVMGSTPIMGRVPRLIKSGVLWKSKRHRG